LSKALGTAASHAGYSTLSGVIDSESFLKDIAGTLASRFRLHEIGEPIALARQTAKHLLGTFATSYGENTIGIERAMSSMRTPWLDRRNASASANGFTELYTLGQALRVRSPFEKELTSALRSTIGDWRDAITWPPDMLANPGARLELYAGLGLDRRLTDFSGAAFDEIALRVGLKNPSTTDQDQPEDVEEAAFVRTNRAHDRLQRFEVKLRRFIDRKMTDVFGKDWIKHKVPGEVVQDWHRKRDKALSTGEQEMPLINYADFTDYMRIIERRDNWDSVFKGAFRRIESVKESFQRLYPIRLCTMHARFVSHDDELYLLIETMRILKAIGGDN
jgi:hypothetical protein